MCTRKAPPAGSGTSSGSGSASGGGFSFDFTPPSGGTTASSQPSKPSGSDDDDSTGGSMEGFLSSLDALRSVLEGKTEKKADTAETHTIPEVHAAAPAEDRIVTEVYAPQTSETYTVSDVYAPGTAGGIKGYNATYDLGTLLANGWKLGIHSMVVLDRGTVFNKMKAVKLDGNFNHRIALVMSSDEASNFMSKTKMMKELVDAQDSISAIYQHMGGREECFRPYTFQ